MRKQLAAVVSIVIPAWRRADLLRECLHSLAEQSERRFRVLVVSNGGGEAVAAAVEAFADSLNCQLISLPENRGFAAGVNAGLAECRTPYVAVLNDDVRLHPEWLRTLVEWLEAHPETAFCAGMILNGDGSQVDNLGDAVARSGAAWRLGHGLPAAAVGATSAAQTTAQAGQLGAPSPVSQTAADAEQPRPLLAASWTALLLRRSLLDTVGLLDETFVSYLEDVDFAVRCLHANARGMLLPAAVCWHQGSASSGGPASAAVFRQMTRNQRLLRAKDFPYAVRSSYRIENNSAFWTWLGMAIRQGHLLAWLAGQLSFLWVLPSAHRRRLRWDEEGEARLRKWLTAGQAAIYADQFSSSRTAPDRYWRVYFALVGKPEPAATRLSGSTTTPS